MNSKINSKKIIIMVLLTLFSVAITALVYLTGGVKYVYAHLMYIPIVIAGFMVGYHGAVVLAIISGLIGLYACRYSNDGTAHITGLDC